MAKFNFSITAHIGNDMMLICSKDFDFNVSKVAPHDSHPVYEMCKIMMGFKEWTFDDGDDFGGTTYCQYVSYDKDNRDNYLLAVWTELDQNGFVKL